MRLWLFCLVWFLPPPLRFHLVVGNIRSGMGGGDHTSLFYSEYSERLVSCNGLSENTVGLMHHSGCTFNEIMRPEQNLCLFYAGRKRKWIIVTICMLLSTLTTKTYRPISIRLCEEYTMKKISRSLEFYRVVTTHPVLKFLDPSLYEVLFYLDIIINFT